MIKTEAGSDSGSRCFGLSGGGGEIKLFFR
jgi:hypothetical protein